MNNGKIIGAGKWDKLFICTKFKTKCFMNFKNKRDIKNFCTFRFCLSYEYLIIAIQAQEIKTWLKREFCFKGQTHLIYF